MKYCLSSRHSAEYLKKVDEIKVNYNDRKVIPDLFEKYPKAQVILNLGADPIDWTEIKNYNVLSQGKLILCARTAAQIQECKDNEIARYYYFYPITNAYDLRAVKDLGVCYVLIDAPIFFNMPLVKSFGIPVRVNPAIAYYDYLPHTDGVCGSWIRPEDTQAYEEFVEVFEFEGMPTHREEALHHIYVDNMTWERPLNEIILNLNASGYSNLVLNDFSKWRQRCRQVCAESKDKCQICYNTLFLADPALIGRLKEKYE